MQCGHLSSVNKCQVLKYIFSLDAVCICKYFQRKVYPVLRLVNCGDISSVEIYLIGIYITDNKTAAISHFLSSNFMTYFTLSQPQWPGTGSNTIKSTQGPNKAFVKGTVPVRILESGGK